MSKTEIATMSDDVFSQLMGDTPDSTVKTDDTLGTVNPDDTKKPDPTIVTVDKVEDKPFKKFDDLSNEDLDTLLEDDTTNKDDKTSTTKKTPESDQVFDEAHFFKAQYEGLVERGIWVALDPEDLENIKWDVETIGAITESQAEFRAQTKYTERKESTGIYGKILFEHIENGGNPEDIIGLFEEVREFSEIDTSTSEGKLDKLKMYYVDELGWPLDKFKRTSAVWVDNDELEDELEFVNKKFDESIQAKIQIKSQEAAQAKAHQEELQKNFSSNITKAVNSREDLSDKDKKIIINNVLTYDKTLPDGRKVNQFTLDFMRMQQDPDLYVDFVRFVQNPKEYNSSVKQKGESEANKKTWDLLKSNGSLSRTTATRANTRANEGTSTLKIDYKALK